jgi:formylglycine-generating enzyme required for sulfatase activity
LTPDDLLLIPGGGFEMGQANGRDDEKPVHRVLVAPFRLCRYQVTVDDFVGLMGRLPNQTHGFPPELPVTSVSWFAAVRFCERLSQEWGMSVRLPTEAEWEFAARGGLDQKLYPWGDDPPNLRPRYAERWREGPEPVAMLDPNLYGLYDMCENVHEWCSDWYDPGYYRRSPIEQPQGPPSGDRKASRGGAWRHHNKTSRCAARSSIPPDFRYADYGFRVAADVRK